MGVGSCLDVCLGFYSFPTALSVGCWLWLVMLSVWGVGVVVAVDLVRWEFG